MSGETLIPIRGRLAADPELKFTPSGAAVVNFRVLTNSSKLDRQTSQWVDQPTKGWRCEAWNQGKLARAENIANMLKKGDAVILYGELVTREYETREGEKRSADEIRVESIGKDLTYHGQAYAQNEQPQAAQSDPWATPPAQNTGGWGTPPDQEPPF
jgi:single-strand DNA-binding protein